MDPITVFVGVFPGENTMVNLNGGRTVKNVLDEANVDEDGYEIRILRNNSMGSPVHRDAELEEGDVVTLMKKIEHS